MSKRRGGSRSRRYKRDMKYAQEEPYLFGVDYASGSDHAVVVMSEREPNGSYRIVGHWTDVPINADGTIILPPGPLPVGGSES